MPNTFLEVGDACSGLRSLISLTALGAVYAYFFQSSMVKKYVLFIISIPIALFANMIRIVGDSWVAYMYGTDVVFKWFHDFSGFLIFGIELVCLFAIGKLLMAKAGRQQCSPTR
jgi:exosortase